MLQWKIRFVSCMPAGLNYIPAGAALLRLVLCIPPAWPILRCWLSNNVIIRERRECREWVKSGIRWSGRQRKGTTERRGWRGEKGGQTPFHNRSQLIKWLCLGKSLTAWSWRWLLYSFAASYNSKVASSCSRQQETWFQRLHFNWRYQREYAREEDYQWNNPWLLLLDLIDARSYRLSKRWVFQSCLEL